MDDISSPADLATALRELRRARSLTQAQLAAAASVSRTRISEIESGEAANIEVQTLMRMLRALGASLAIQPGGRPNLNQILRDRERSGVSHLVSDPAKPG
jgi:transcriptional regulator with XRE-family HTH domain